MGVAQMAARTATVGQGEKRRMSQESNLGPGARPGGAGRLARKVWRRLVARKLTTSDDYQRLNRFYAMEDPWELGSGRERVRFEQTNAVIEERLGRVGTVLEIGCGEGHQSLHLARICDRLVGIDVSERAVARARTRVPDAEFLVGDLGSLGQQTRRFDLVLACEVLYYVKDVPAAIARMSALGSACLVTFFCPSSRIVAPHLPPIPFADRGWIAGDSYAWLYALWRPEAPPVPGTERA
jgi:SAM-dependent methyltransferase